MERKKELNKAAVAALKIAATARIFAALFVMPCQNTYAFPQGSYDPEKGLYVSASETGQPVSVFAGQAKSLVADGTHSSSHSESWCNPGPNSVCDDSSDDSDSD